MPSQRLTLKALANFSPGLFQPWVQGCSKRLVATLKEFAIVVLVPVMAQPLQGCVSIDTI